MVEPPPRLKPLLVNPYERRADRLLTDEALAHGDRLLTKVRLADVVDVDGAGPDQLSYGLRAHLDFLMIDAETSLPKFAVELDGAQHWTDPAARRRDRAKDALCEWGGLPLLRITSDFSRRLGRRQVLSYVIEAFYLAEAFYEAQDSGDIPLDEPFVVTSVVVRAEDGSLAFNALDHEARLSLLRSSKAGRLPHFAPDEYHTVDKDAGAVQSHALMAVAPNRYLVARSRVRDFRFQGISPSELAGQISVAQLGDMANRWLAGEPMACDARRLSLYMADIQGAIDSGGFLASATGNSLAGSCQPV